MPESNESPVDEASAQSRGAEIIRGVLCDEFSLSQDMFDSKVRPHLHVAVRTAWIDSAQERAAQDPGLNAAQRRANRRISFRQRCVAIAEVIAGGNDLHYQYRYDGQLADEVWAMLDTMKASLAFIEAKIEDVMRCPPRPLRAAQRVLREWKAMHRIARTERHPEFPNWTPVKSKTARACVARIQDEIAQVMASAGVAHPSH